MIPAETITMILIIFKALSPTLMNMLPE